MDLPRSIWPLACNAPAPRMATPIASSHMRMRLQSPMLTMSDTAPMVQKWVFWPMAPKAKATAKASQRTGVVAILASMVRLESKVSNAVWRGIGNASGGKAFGTQAARIADTAGTAQLIGLIAGNRQAVINTERGTGADDLGLGQGNQRRVKLQLVAFDTGLGGEIGHFL